MKNLSIILPIYNVEQYLIRCFDSIYSQGIDESLFEVIAVIDGSPDNSFEKASEYAKSHGNLLVVNKENGGVSSARNKGIELAKGKYIMFVDPDDTLIAGSLVKLLSSLERFKSDIYILRSFDEMTRTEIFRWNRHIETQTCYSGLEAYERGYSRSAIWGCVYNKQFLKDNQILFPLNIKNSEDAFFFMRCQILSNKMIFLDIEVYNLFTRPGSASRDISKDRLVLWFNTLKLLKDFRKSDAKNALEISLVDGLIYAVISDITKNAIKLMHWNAKEFLLQHGVKEYIPISKENMRRSSPVNQLMKHVFNISFAVWFALSYIRYK